MPTPRADRLLAIGLWVVVALSCLQILLFGFGRDQGIYAVVAEGLLSGKMPYRDLWDFKPPGIYFVYAAAQALFGETMAAPRILEALGVLGLVFAFRRLGATLSGSSLAGLVGGALAALIHAELEFWHTGQPESFGGMCTAFALVVTTNRGVDLTRSFRERVRAWGFVGLLFGVAFLLKPPIGGGVVVCAVYLAFAEYLHARRVAAAFVPVLVTGLASLVPIAACVAWFWARGAWPALSWTLFEFTPGYTALGWSGNPLSGFQYGLVEALTGFSFVLPVGIPLAIALPKLHAHERGGLSLIAGIVAVHVVGIALQAKFFQYHYAATLPLLAFMAGIGLFKLWRRATAVPGVGQLLVAAAVMALAAGRVALRHNPGTFWERSADRMAFLFLRSPSREELDHKLYHVVDYSLDADRRAGHAVAALTLSDEPIFVWGFEPSVYWFSRRRPASRYLYDVPQRATWGRERARDDLLSDLSDDPPRVIVVQHGDVFSFVTGDDLDSAHALQDFPALRDRLLTDYTPAETIDNLDLYIQKKSSGSQ